MDIPGYSLEKGDCSGNDLESKFEILIIRYAKMNMVQQFFSYVYIHDLISHCNEEKMTDI